MDPIIRLLRDRRVDLRISQEALARLCGTSQSAISEFEAGSINGPTLSTIRKVCDVLEIDLIAATRPYPHPVRSSADYPPHQPPVKI